MPITVQPLIFATWPTTEPTAPAAPDTTTTSPGFASPTSSSPKYAVIPGMPSVERKTGSGARRWSTFVSSFSLRIAYSCTPRLPTTWSPGLKRRLFEATTAPTPPARITSSRATGRM